MKATQDEKTLLETAGFSYEYPGFWARRDITISDGISINDLPWEVQQDSISRSAKTVEGAIAFADRLEVTGFWKQYGFAVTGTGGGCEALEQSWGEGEEYRYIWITDEGDPSLPDTLDSQVCVGWYDHEGNDLKYLTAENSAAALHGILAHDFADRLKALLTEEQWNEMRRRNNSPPEKYANEQYGTCASHDFLDANMVMHDAFISVVGHESDAASETDAAIWSGAWDYATTNLLTEKE